MNYYKLAMKVFNEHKSDFVKLAIRRAKLKQKLIGYRNYGNPPDPVELAVLRKGIKKEEERLNNLIKEFLR